MHRSTVLLATPLLALAAFVGYATVDARTPRATIAGAGQLVARDEGDELAALERAPSALPERTVRAPAITEAVEQLGPSAREVGVVALDPADAWARLSTNAAGTYIGDILHERGAALARWGDRRADPIRLWIAEGNALDGWQPTDAETVRDAFDEWATIGLPVRFVLVRDSTSADVRVTWVRGFDEPINGRTVWTRDANYWIHGADVVLALHHRHGPRLDSAQLRAIALHEAGHVLGLDHAAQAKHIMSAQVRARSLTDADHATARLLYSVPAGRVAAP
jgi:hypothetical protein